MEASSLNPKAILASLVGNTLEYYDFCLYGTFSPIISQYFFPVGDQGISLALFVYALAFIMRPLGALLFGYIGDKISRKKSLGVSLILMSFCTFSIALIPSYAEIGIFSSFLLVASRLGQGLCMGGEYGGSLVFAMEHNSNVKSLGFISGLIGSSTLLGCLLANFISFLSSSSIFFHEYWKIPFLLGGSIGIVGFWIRYKTEESPIFNQIKTMSINLENPISSIFSQRLPEFIIASALAGLSGFASSFTVIYMNVYLISQLEWALSQSLLLISFGLLISIIICPISSKICQIYNPHYVLRICLIGYILFAFPCMLLSSKSAVTNVTLAMCILSILNGMSWGCSNYYVYTLFPPQGRYTSIAISDSFGKILLSGPTPLLCNFIVGVTHSILSPAFYIIAIAILVWLFIENSNRILIGRRYPAEKMHPLYSSGSC